MPQQRKRIAVVGGANVDIGGFSSGPLVSGDSNPGRVRISVGGVGRNIAENARRLGLGVELVTALGGDTNGRMLLEDCMAKEIGTGSCLVDEQARTSVYLFIDDAQGEMHCAVNDMEVQLSLTPEALAPRLEMLGRMDAVVLDANLPAATIEMLARELTVPLFADPVSTAKAGKLRGALGRLQAIKPNRLEAEILTGMPIRDFMDAAEAARRLADMGVKQVYLTMGEQGALCADARQCIFLPGQTRGVLNTTGAGDAFMAALVWSFCEGMDLRRGGIAGMAASQIAMGSLETVNPDMNRANLMKKMADVEARM